MTDRRSKNSATRSERLSRFSSKNTSIKKMGLTKNSDKSKQLKIKRQANNKKKNSVEVDSLLSDGILPPNLKPKPTRKSERRKNVSFEICNKSITDRKKSLRSSKKACLDLETEEQAQNHTKSDKENTAKKGRAPKSKVRVSKSVSSNTSDSALLLNSFSVNDCSFIEESIPLDDLLFVTSSRKKKARDITESSGICSAHSSLISSFNTSTKNSTCNSLKDNSLINMTGKNEIFKFPKTKRPGKNTLKHKRLIFSELIKGSLDHEDDILENINLTPLKNVSDIDNESEISWNMATPKCGFKVSPILPKKTPVFKDCISPTELRISRKKAEEYMCRNRQQKTLCLSPEIARSKVPAKNIDVMEFLSTLQQKGKNIPRSLRDELSSDEERDDDYYSEEESIQNY